MRCGPVIATILGTLLIVTLLTGPRFAMGVEPEPPPVKLLLHPAAAPDAALKYQLLPRFLDRTAGNAAVIYGKVKAEQNPFFSNRELWNNIPEWIAAPLSELRANKPARQAVERSTVFQMLQRASRYASCDWQLPIREQTFFEILLPEVQETRSFARLLALRARVQIADGDFDEALKTLQIGYAMARHVAEGETLINGLVGMAIAHMMSDQLQELVQQPGAPNLYWALTMLPRPVVDLRPGVEAEMYAVQLSFPPLREPDQTIDDVAYWRIKLDEVFDKFGAFANDSGVWSRRELRTAMALRGYPRAKRTLLAQGLPATKVEAMPVPQALLLAMTTQFEELRDETFKWFFVPYWQAQAGVRQAEQRMKDTVANGEEILPLASLFLPGIAAVRAAVARSERRIAVLRVIEALRLHAAAHGGRLPAQLDAVSEVPVPVDPVTGRPFSYQLRGDTARLSGPPLPGAPLNLEIQSADE